MPSDDEPLTQTGPPPAPRPELEEVDELEELEELEEPRLRPQPAVPPEPCPTLEATEAEPPPARPRPAWEPGREPERNQRSFALRMGVGIAVVAALAAAGVVSYALGARMRHQAPVRDWPTAEEEPRSRMIDGLLMRWEEHGREGLPVVLVHGMPTNPRVWRRVIPRLSDGRIYAWEMVGYGRSIRSGLGRDISVAAQAGYLRDWMRALGIERAVLVGHDLGGGVVQRVALANPELVAGIVLIDSAAFNNWPVAALRVARSVRRALPLLPNSAVRPLFEAALANLGHDDPQVRRESSRLFWAPYRSGRAGVAFANQLGSLDNRDTRTVSLALGDLAVPARVVWGSRDPLDVASGRRLATLLRAPMDLIDGAHHFTPEAHPDIVASAIEYVVNAVPAPLPVPAAEEPARRAKKPRKEPRKEPAPA